jgi:hypothetical protein
MREIKFRAWLIEQKRMTSGGELQDARIWDINENSNEVWMQYTGLKDKNSVEIYEGDIVIKPGWPNDVYEVQYDDAAFNAIGQNNSDTLGFVTYWEVIGNTYENPDLLQS